ncbi:hypothetical protein PoB_006969700 [Plakobranchus ocellatus]|uniref:Uncharacterized protein n=1 Tax=Plakobranchus ocellatus TaxID=259542 RepID=A0AAV4DGT5_9GAST|nr:hypothetical protein PoB_006969700 [Plakobranchus ocellatus]
MRFGCERQASFTAVVISSFAPLSRQTLMLYRTHDAKYRWILQHSYQHLYHQHPHSKLKIWAAQSNPEGEKSASSGVFEQHHVIHDEEEMRIY